MFIFSEVIFAIVMTLVTVSLSQLISEGAFILAAAVIGAWPSVSFAAYEKFVNIPLLEFRFTSDNKLYKLEVDDAGAGRCFFLRAEILNNGRKSAERCEIKVRFPKSGRETKDDQPCPSPSDEFETWIGITWAGSGKYRRSIPPGGNAVADILVISRDILSRGGIKWLESARWGDLIAWIATLPVAGGGFLNFFGRLGDSLCEAKYQMDVGVFPANSEPMIKTYRLTVNRTWENTNLEPWVKTPMTVAQ
jgi:hypothetical protein